MQMIQNYLHLPFEKQTIAAPYFNNRRQKVRGALRVLIGKGNPDDIVEEAAIFGLKERVDMQSISAEQMKKFLVDHNIGVDCSALAYYVLDEELKARKKSGLKNFLYFQPTINPLRKILIALRPIENAGVKTFHNTKNSRQIELSEIQPGDCITMIGTGRDHDLNHMLVIHKVEYTGGTPKMLHYTHSLAWSTDGQYNHGVCQGKIGIVDIKKPLIEQKWTEKNKEGTENETYWRATTAQELSIDRIKSL